MPKSRPSNVSLCFIVYYTLNWPLEVLIIVIKVLRAQTLNKNTYLQLRAQSNLMLPLKPQTTQVQRDNTAMQPLVCSYCCWMAQEALQCTNNVSLSSVYLLRCCSNSQNKSFIAILSWLCPGPPRSLIAASVCWKMLTSKSDSRVPQIRLTVQTEPISFSPL